MAKGEDPEKVINEGYGFEFSQDDMKKVKKENKKLKDYLKRKRRKIRRSRNANKSPTTRYSKASK